MKKTFSILAALASLAVASAVDSTIVSFATVNTLTETAVHEPLSGKPATANKVVLTNYALGGTGITMSLTAANVTQTKMWDDGNSVLNQTWVNDAAIGTMNSDLGTSITTAQLLGNNNVYLGAGGARIETLTFNLSASSLYNAGEHVVLYLGVSAVSVMPTALSVTSGLDNATVTYAYDGSDGFVNTISGRSAKDLVLVRIEGDLTAAETISLGCTGGNKVGLSMMAIVPEPATATLSLLALAGLAARRRRK